MDARKQLSRLRYLKMAIEQTEDQIELLRETMTHVAAIRYDKDAVQQSPADTLAEYVVRLEALETRAVKLCAEYSELWDITMKRIGGLENELQRNVLLLRYVAWLPFHEIAKRLGYSDRHMYNTHAAALKAYDRNYPECKE